MLIESGYWKIVVKMKMEEGRAERLKAGEGNLTQKEKVVARELNTIGTLICAEGFVK